MELMLRLRLRLRQEWDQWVGRCRKEGSPVQDEQPVQSCGDHNRREVREALGQEGFWYCLGGLGLRLWEAQVGQWAREQQYGWLCHGEPSHHEYRGQCGRGGGPKLRLMDLQKSRGEGRARTAHEVRLRIQALRALAEWWSWLI